MVVVAVSELWFSWKNSLKSLLSFGNKAKQIAVAVDLKSATHLAVPLTRCLMCSIPVGSISYNCFIVFSMQH